jgi:serine/threonine-protein kinase
MLQERDYCSGNRSATAKGDVILSKKYKIRSVLGSGGFGVTFLARNISLPAEPLCVIKKFAPRVTDPNLIAIARKQFDLESYPNSIFT